MRARTLLLLALVSSLWLPGSAQAFTAPSLQSDELSGNATLGDSIGGGTIPQNGQCNPTGKGLHAPGLHGQGKNKAKGLPVVVNKEVYYRLHIDDDLWYWLDNTGLTFHVGSIDICGIISPGPGGIGAACGSTMGRNGRGKLQLGPPVAGFPPKGPATFDLTNLGWVPTQGSVLLMYGHVQHVDPVTKAKLETKGTFLMPLTVTGASSCVNSKPGGARSFTVTANAVGFWLPKP